MYPLVFWKGFHGIWGGGFTKNRKGNDYLFVEVDKFIKMFVLMPYKMTIRGKETTNVFFEYVWQHLGIQMRNFLIRIIYFSIHLGLHNMRRWTPS